MKLITILIIIIIVPNSLLYSQNYITNNYKNLFNVTNNSEIKTNFTNETDGFVLELFFFYKKYISSQDGNHCPFYPSCSLYFVHSIKKHGVLIGVFETFDRLTRCNPNRRNQYMEYEKSGLMYDPVK